MIPKYNSNFFLIFSLQTLVKLRNTQFLAFTSMLLQKSYLSTSVLTMLLTLLVLDFGSENGPWRNLQFLPNWHLPSRNQFLHFSGGYDSLDLERYVKKKKKLQNTKYWHLHTGNIFILTLHIWPANKKKCKEREVLTIHTCV